MDQTTGQIATGAPMPDDLRRLPGDGPSAWNDADRSELRRLGAQMANILASPTGARTCLPGTTARYVAIALGELAAAYATAGLLPEVDQVPCDASPDKCWADASQQGTGAEASCPNDAVTAIGLCWAHARQFKSR